MRKRKAKPPKWDSEKVETEIYSVALGVGSGRAEKVGRTRGRAGWMDLYQWSAEAGPFAASGEAHSLDMAKLRVERSIKMLIALWHRDCVELTDSKLTIYHAGHDDLDA